MDVFQPKRARAYKIPEVLKSEIDREVDSLLNEGFIRPSKSPMASPIVCVLKADKKEVRLICDYRYVNSFTVADPFPMPDADQIMSTIGRAKWISLWDANKGYWQTEVKGSDQWLTGFIAHNELYEWTRTPFGMKNSGATFVRAMQTVLHAIREFSD
jgi:hypothetical protein